MFDSSLRHQFSWLEYESVRFKRNLKIVGIVKFTLTKLRSKVKTPSSRGLGHYPFTVGTGVRIPVGSPSCEDKKPQVHAALEAFLFLIELQPGPARVKHGIEPYPPTTSPFRGIANDSHQCYRELHMFTKFFKKTIVAPSTATTSPRVVDSTGVLNERRRIPRPLPTAQIVEGDGGEADWALWLEATRTPETDSAPAIQHNKAA